MDLSTKYLGFELSNPIVPGASSLCDDLDTVRRLEDAGAPALIMRSLFQEQIQHEEEGLVDHHFAHQEGSAEAQSFMPDYSGFVLDLETYLEQLAKIKNAVKIPLFASLNGVTPGGWTRYATLLEEAGADALELNLYHLATNPELSSLEVESALLDLVRLVKMRVSIPVAVKISPDYSSVSHFCYELQEAGADAVVIFNRFYQPDIDPEELEVTPRLHLSNSGELHLRLRWLAVLSAFMEIPLAATGGIHTEEDVIKAMMAGASITQCVSALLIHGPHYFKTLLDGVSRWLEEHEYESLSQAKGSMNLAKCPDPFAYERANYAKLLQTWGRF